MPHLIEPLEARIAPAFAATFYLAALNGANGLAIYGAAAGDGAGYSVSAAGDVNGDRFDDIIIGANTAAPNGLNSGAAYVVFGHRGGFSATLDLAALDGITNGFAIAGAAPGDLAGMSVRAAGDVNGDGIADLIAGASGADAGGADAGAGYVLFGQTRFPATVELGSLDGTNGFRLTGPSALASAGYSVSGAGDVNGDGFDDIIVGAPNADAGAAYVVFGRASGFGADFALAGVNGINGFKVSGVDEGDGAGASVSGAGDVNGDGFADIVIGAPFASPSKDYSGAAYVVFGRASGFAPNLNASSLNGINGFRITGANDYDYAGYAVNAAGDLNGDGFGDVIVGARQASPNGDYSGAAHVIFGKSAAFNPSLNLGNLNGNNGFKISGVAEYDYAGASAATAGDVNGDGLDDLIVGATGVKRGALEIGAAYVIYGKRSAFNPNINLASLNGNNGFAIFGIEADGGAGFSVSGAGDLNGDGVDDFIIGAYSSSPNGKTDAGISYVIFGQGPGAGPRPGEVMILKNGKLAIYLDVDGDLVKIKTKKGFFTQANFELHLEGAGAFLDRIDLANQPGFANTSLKVKAQPGALAGNGSVNIGAIDAAGIDLKKIALPGDLADIRAGDGNPFTPGVKALKIGSFHALDPRIAADETADPGHGVITGGIGALTVAGNFNGYLEIAGGPFSKIGKIVIGGRLDGSAGGSAAGFISGSGDIGSVRIKGGIAGGAEFSGLSAGGAIGRLTVNGSVIGPDGAPPVLISASAGIDRIKVGGNVAGAQFLAGYLGRAPVNPDAAIGSVRVEGRWERSDLIAGIADVTGDGFGQNDAIIGIGNSSVIASIAKIVIKGALAGSAVPGDSFALSAGNIVKAKLGGSKLALSAGRIDVVSLDPANGDFRLVELR